MLVHGTMETPTSGASSAISRRRLLRDGTYAVVGAAAGITAGLSLPRVGATTEQKLVVRREISDLAANHPAEFEKLKAGIQELKARSARDASDPKGWSVNANSHNLFCAIPGATTFEQIRKDNNQIHFCWWFLPWHRAFLHITEKKIQAAAGDETIGLPYWNWTISRRIPAPYADRSSSLWDARRFGPARPIQDSEVGYRRDDPTLAKLGVEALKEDKFSAPLGGGTSFGGSPRPGLDYEAGTFEGTPHGPIHNYVGGERRVGRRVEFGDMADFATAALDPIFFAHHGNLDRAWETWRQDPVRKKTEPSIEDFDKHEFMFSGVDGAPIAISVHKTLEADRLGYRYDTLDLFNGQQVVPDVAAVTIASGGPLPPLPPVASAVVGIPAPVSAMSATQPTRRIQLRIDGIEPPATISTIIAFVKPADQANADPGIPVGSFSFVRSGSVVTASNSSVVFDVTHALRQFAGTSNNLRVTLIPQRLSNEQSERYEELRFRSISIEPMP